MLEAQRISRLNRVEAKFFSVCAVEGCERNPSQIHHIRRLNRVWKGKLMATKSTKGKPLAPGIKSYKSVLARKQIPLCAEHHLKLEKGQISTDVLRKSYTISGVRADLR